VKSLAQSFGVLATVLLASAASTSAATITVNSGGDLQAALTKAVAGDTIVLQAGATFTGNFYLPNKSGSTYITVRSSAADSSLPAAGVRITPTYASKLPKIVGKGTSYALKTSTAAHHWKLQFLEIVGNTSGAGDIVQFGNGSEPLLANQAHDLVLDRVYIHGDKTKGAKRGVALNSVNTMIRDSYISGIMSTQDSQAICGWNGPGPFQIDNNYLEATGENVMFGGATPKIANLVPSDITFVRNTVTKPTAWKGSTWTVKNLFELKNGRRILVKGNTFQYSWAAQQKGYAVVMAPVNDGYAPWTTIEDVTIQANSFTHVAGGFLISGYDKTHGSKTMARVLIQDNLLTDVSAASWGGPGGFAVVGNGAQDVTIDHNTVVHDGFVLNGNGTPSPRFKYTNNLSKHNQWGIYGDGLGAGQASIDKYFPASIVARNVLAGGSPSKYPADNFFPATADFLTQFVNASGGDYHLGTWSPYRAAGTDGKDVGANVDTIAAAKK
jgi:hypothetical protein